MQPIPVKVKNVNVYNFPITSGIPAVIEGASGTYAIGTLGLSVFYNLDLTGGKQTGKLQVHGSYVATGEYENGTQFTTVALYCLEAGKKPEFGRTIIIEANAAGDSATSQPLHVPAFNVLWPLTNITVSQLFPAPAIGQLLLIEDATGNVIGSKVGTPHIMGVEVKGGKRFGNLHAGMKNIIISGTTKDGLRQTFTDETCLAAGDPAIFFRLFP